MNLKRICIWFWLIVKRILVTPVMVALIIALPACSYAGMYCSKSQNSGDGDGVSGPVAVLYAEDDDVNTLKIIEKLCDSESMIKYYASDTQEAFADDIRSEKADFGYIFKKNLTQRLDEKSYKGAIRLVTSESSYITSVSNEIVFKQLFQIYAVDIAVNYIESNTEYDSMRKQAVEYVRERYEGYIDNTDISYFQFESVKNDGTVGEIEPVEVTIPIRGVFGVMIMVAAMSGGVMYCRDRKRAIFAALTVKMACTGAYVYVAAPTVIFALSAESAMYILGVTDIVQEAFKIVIYICILVAVNGTLALIVKDGSLFAGAIPVFSVISLVFCPIFFNIASVVPFIRYMCYLLPVIYYL